MLRRLERNGLAFCVGAAVLALALRGGRIDVTLGVLGGGGLVAVSYWAIKTSIDSLTRAVATGSAGRHLAWPLLKLGGRYALLAFLAYVMIARLRLHPIGLLTGASSLVVAAAVEAFRVMASSRTPRAP